MKILAKRQVRPLVARSLIVALVSSSLLAISPIGSLPAKATTNETDYYLDFADSSYLSSSAAAEFSIEDGFTAEAWVHFDSGDTTDSVIFDLAASGDQLYLKTSAVANSTAQQLVGYAYDSATTTHVVPYTVCGLIQEGSWHHVAISIDSTHLNCFVNGVETGQIARVNTTAQFSERVQLGKWANSGADNASGDIDGFIDQVKIWDSALSELALSASMHTWGIPTQDLQGNALSLSGQLKHHYDFNEQGSGSAEDKVGAADLSLTGSASYSNVATSSTSGTQTTITFPRSYLTSSGGWTPPSGLGTVDALVVGGGGGGGGTGGRSFSGGGGAGGIVREGQVALSSSTLSVRVGQGGQGGSASSRTESKDYPRGGIASALGNLVANGGGAGGHAMVVSYASTDVSAPGPGGGGGAQAGAYAGGAAQTYGFAGGAGFGAGTVDPQAAGGGSGAGAAGVSATSGSAGSGGAGVPSDISGVTVHYGGGGGGGKRSAIGTAGAGGIGGGGAGGKGSEGQHGVTNLGGGGGGAGGDPFYAGGNGGSGVVILSYSTIVPAPLNVTVSPAALSLSVSWSAITGTDFTGATYRVDYSEDGSTWTTATSSTAGTSYSITGLTAGTSYFVRVAAVTGQGVGPWGYPWTEVFRTTNPVRNGSGQIDYATGYGLSGNAVNLSRTDFTRVRYRLEAKYLAADATPFFADVNFAKGLTNMNTSSNPSEEYTDLSRLQVPIPTAGSSQFELHGTVSDLNVISNHVNVTNVYGSTGRVEIWPWDYGVEAAAGLTNNLGSNTVYDFADYYTSSGSYGSFQIHNLGSSPHTVLAWNYHRGTSSNVDIGFGNSSGFHPDWTFAGGSNSSNFPRLHPEDRTAFKFQSFANLPTAPLSGAVAPTITSHPANTSKTVGQSATLSVTATRTDGGTLSYQWQKGGVDLVGATSASFSIFPVNESHAGEYRVVVKNTLSGTSTTTTSNVATLTVSPAMSATTPSSNLVAYWGVPYQLPIAVSGGATSKTYVVATNFLPAGLSLNSSTGVISGTPTSVGDSTVSIRITDANNSQVLTNDFTISVRCAPNSMLVTSGLVVHLDAANECSTATSGTWRDISGNNRHLTFYDGSNTSSPSVVTSDGRYFDFPRSPQRHGRFSDGMNHFVNGFSISVMAKFDAAGSYERIIDFGNGAEQQVILVSRLGTSNDLYVEFWGGGLLFNCRASNAIVNGSWQHYAITVDFWNGCDFYRNGSPIASNVNTSVQWYAADSTRSNNYLGRSNWGADQYLDGGIADLALYGRALTSSEVSSNYSAQSSTVYVQYALNGGQVSTASTSAVSGSTITLPTPTKAGYGFVGWYSDAALTQLVGSAGSAYLVGSANTTILYAKWTDTFTVTYNSQGGSAVTAGSFTSGGSVTLPAGPTRSGYSFAGWSASQNGTALTSPYSPGVLQNIVLYALWTSVRLSVTPTLSYADATYSPSGTVTPTITLNNHDGTATYSASPSDVCSVNSSGVATILKVGTCTVTASYPQTSGYEAVSVQDSFAISAADQASLVWNQSSISMSYLGSLDLTGLVTGGSGTGSLSYSASGCTISGNVLSGGSPAATCTVTVTKGADINYNSKSLSQVISVSKINQSSLSIANPGSVVFGNTIQLSHLGGSGTGAVTFNSTSTSICTEGTEGEFEFVGVGDCVVTVSKAADSNYNSASGSLTITVAKANHSVSFTSTAPLNPVTNGTYTVSGVSSTLDPNLAPNFRIASGSSAICSISGTTVTFTIDGVCDIEAYKTATANYNAAPVTTQRIVVGQANQNITFGVLSSKTFGDPAFTVSATTSSQNPVTFSRGPNTTNNACSVTSAGLIVVAAVGTCEVVANSASANGFAAASAVSRSFEVYPDLPGSPFISAISFGDGSLTATFLAPGYLGGGTLVGYVLEAYDDLTDTRVASESGCPISGTLSCTVTGLTNGTSYYLKVTALNEMGLGLPSPASLARTPAANPAAVSNLTALQGNTTLTVTWQAPVSLGGGTFDSYRIFHRPTGGSYGSYQALTAGQVASATVGGVTTFEITGLTNGQGYDVKVVTVTTANTAQLTSNTAEVSQTPFTVPDAPPTVTVLDVADDIVITWSVPIFDGGDAISDYEVLLNSVPAQCAVTSPTSCTIPKSGLTPGTTVNIDVKAENGAGLSSPVSTTYQVAAAPGITVTPTTPGFGGNDDETLESVSGKTWVWTKRISKTQVKVYIKFPEMGLNYQVNLQKNDGKWTRKMSKTINSTSDSDLLVVGDWYYLVRTIDLPGEGAYRIQVLEEGEEKLINGRDRPVRYSYR